MSGSSPRVRGTLPIKSCLAIQRRFIPAGAGNTNDSLKLQTETPVHPRGCGEHPSVPRFSTIRRGSSPRVRGTLSRCSA